MGRVILEKVVLRNWHAFVNNVFDISENSTLITGMNASGKTTLLDAISIILNGANSNDFNIAVKDEGERRTISGALHYVQSGQPSRPGKVTGLILAQFYDENYNVRFLNGVFLRSKSYASDISISQRFFSVINMSIDNADFTIDMEKCKIPKQIEYPNKKKAFEEFFRLRKMQHLKMDIYKGLINSILKAKLDCAPSEFVIKNILPEDDKITTVESLKRNYKLLDDREKMFSELAEEAKFLNKIHEDWAALKKSELDYILLTLSKKKNIKEQIDLKLNERTDLEKLSASIKMEKYKLDEKLSDLNIAFGECKVSDLATEKKKEIATQSRELDSLKKEVSRINKAVCKMNELAEMISNRKTYSKESSDSDIDLLLKDTDIYIDSLDDILLNLRYENQMRKKEIEEANVHLRELRKGKIISTSLPAIGTRMTAANELANALNKCFEEQDIDDYAAPLYELVDSVKQKSWQPAIEMLLGNRRLHIVVKPENERIATEVQNKTSLKGDTDIILSSKLRKVTPALNSVANLINSKSEVVKNIIDAYYGNYILCDDMVAYNSNDCAILKTGMHKNRASSHKASKTLGDEMLLIGTGMIKKIIIDTESKLIIMNKLDREKVSEMNKVMKLKKELNQLAADIKSFLPLDPSVLETFEIKTKAIAALHKETEKLSKEMKESRIKRISLEIREVKLRISGFTKELDATIFKKLKISEDLERLGRSLSEVEREIDVLDRTVIANEQFEKFYQEMDKDDKTIKKISENQRLLLSEAKSIINRIQMAQTEFNLKFNADLKIGLSSEVFDSYEKRLTYLNGKAFNEISEEIKKLKDSLVESKVGVFKGIAESFEFAEREVEKINEILMRYEISGNTFKITLNPATRRRDLYHAIKGFSNDEVVPENIRSCLDEYFNKMIHSKDEKAFYDLADYRNYLDCDVMILTEGTKVWKSFTTEKGNFSGGQKETPYYMCLAAALSCKAYLRGGVRLILLDEAFKNMDQINKTKALSMFKALNLQVILFTSNSDLADCIENIYVITKHANRIVTAFGSNGNALKVVDSRVKVS